MSFVHCGAGADGVWRSILQANAARGLAPIDLFSDEVDNFEDAVSTAACGASSDAATAPPVPSAVCKASSAPASTTAPLVPFAAATGASASSHVTPSPYSPSKKKSKGKNEISQKGAAQPRAKGTFGAHVQMLRDKGKW